MKKKEGKKKKVYKSEYLEYHSHPYIPNINNCGDPKGRKIKRWWNPMAGFFKLLLLFFLHVFQQMQTKKKGKEEDQSIYCCRVPIYFYYYNNPSLLFIFLYFFQSWLVRALPFSLSSRLFWMMFLVFLSPTFYYSTFWPNYCLIRTFGSGAIHQCFAACNIKLLTKHYFFNCYCYNITLHNCIYYDIILHNYYHKTSHIMKNYFKSFGFIISLIKIQRHYY